MAAAFDRLIFAGIDRIILTVSPVPLQTTFSGQDCILAITQSKAVLRCAAEALASSFGRAVDYFPSFEIVQSGGLAAFEDDFIHVRRDVVKRITQLLMDNSVSN